MPCLDISTNVSLHQGAVDAESMFSELTEAVSQIVGIPRNILNISSTYIGHMGITWEFVMVLVKGSVAITFGGNKEPAALAEIVSMGEINSQVKRKLIATIGSILYDKLSIPKTRFVLKVFDGRKANPKL